MARKPKSYVLDSWAILAYLGDESAGKEVAELMADAHDGDTPLLMSVVNVGEVWYILARQFSEAEADKGVEGLRQLGIQFIDADWKLTRQAGIYKSRMRMSYADCFAAAMAKEHKSELVTGDREFRQVEAEIRMAWLET